MDSDLLVRLTEKLDEQTFEYSEGERWGLYAPVTDDLDLRILPDEFIDIIYSAKKLSQFVWREEYVDRFTALSIFKYDDQILLSLEFSLGLYKEQSIILQELTLGLALEFLKRNPGVWKSYSDALVFY